MSLLDMRTVVLGYAISNAICALIIAFLWQQNHSRFRGLGYWLADFLFQFTGIALIALRGSIPDFLSIVVSNSLLIAGTLLLFIGLEHFTEKISSQAHNYLLVAVFTIIQIYFTVVSPNLMARDINIALGHLIICLQCLWLVVFRVDGNMRAYTRQMGLVFAALCLVSLGYGSLNLIVPPINNFFQAGSTLAISVMSFQMAYMGLTFELIMLVNRRILNESLIDINERKRAEIALSKSEEGIRTLFENTPIGMFQSTPGGKIIYVNPAFAAIMGYSSTEEITEIINRSSVAETIYEDPTRRPILVGEVSQNEGIWKTYENRYRCKDGKIIDAILSFSERQDPVTGKPTLYGFVQDITERKRAEEALRDSERWLRLAQEAANAGTWEWDLRTDENIWSASLYKLYGLEPYSCPPSYEAWQATIVNEDRPKAEQAVQAAVRNGTELSTEWRVRYPDGIERWLMSRGQPIRDSQNVVIRYRGIVFDITDQKRTELALHDLSARYEAILDTVPDIVAEVDKNKVYTWVNQAGRQFFGEAVIGKEAATYFEGEQETYEKVQPLFNGDGDVFYVESWQRRQNGEKRLLAWWCRSIVDAGGKVTGALSTARDITENQRAEAAIREAEEKYRNIFESTLIGIFRTTLDGRYILVNPAYARILGYDSPESLMQSVQDIGRQIYVDANERSRLIEDLERQGEISYESRIIRKDGLVVDVRVDDSVVRGQDGRVLYYQGTVLDITDGKRAQEALRQRAEELQRLMDTAPIAILMALDPKCMVVTGNLAANQLYDANQGDNISASNSDEKRLAVRRFFQNGRELLPEELPIQIATALGKEVQNAEVEVMLPGGNMMTMLGAASPLFDAEMKVRGAVAAFMDITERKKAEEKLRSALEEKEILLREVHHRVKNNLQAIVYLIEMQSAHLSDESSLQFLKELEEQARTMSLVYEQVYQSDNLARIGMASYLQKLAENVLIAFCRGRIVQLNLDVAPIDLNVEQAMPCGLIVNELVTNSLKYAFPPDHPNQPAISISLQPVDDFYRLRVGDNGAGIPADLNWQTSCSLGLRLVRLWATHQLGGTIELAGENGATFEITFLKSGT